MTIDSGPHPTICSTICPVVCYIGIGSNLDNPRLQVTRALQNMAQLPSITLLRRSPWYFSKAIGPGTQADYINGIIEIETKLTPHQLLAALQNIETAQGRTRELRWGARTLDLDLLVYGDQEILSEDLQIPHPRMRERNFVLTPLADLNPQLKLPLQHVQKHAPNNTKNETIAALLSRLPDKDSPQNRLWRVEGENAVVGFEQVNINER